MLVSPRSITKVLTEVLLVSHWRLPSTLSRSKEEQEEKSGLTRITVNQKISGDNLLISGVSKESIFTMFMIIDSSRAINEAKNRYEEELTKKQRH